MAGLFKKLAKAVEDGGERAGLDEINEKILKEFKEKLTLLKKDSNAEAAANEIVERCNADYDQRAKKETKRSVPEDWNQDNKDLICVRKRMLNRSLQAAIKEFLEAAGNQILLEQILEESNTSLRTFVGQVTNDFPLPRPELDVRIMRNKLSIQEQARAKLPTIDAEPQSKMVDATGRTWAQFCESTLVDAESKLKADNENKIKTAIATVSADTNTRLRLALEAVLSAADAEFSAKMTAMQFLSDPERAELKGAYDGVTTKYRAAV